MAAGQPDERLARLTTAATPQEAHIIADMLQSEGVKASVVGDFLAGGFGEMTGTNPEIWVAEDDLPKATALLQAAQERAAHDEEE